MSENKAAWQSACLLRRGHGQRAPVALCQDSRKEIWGYLWISEATASMTGLELWYAGIVSKKAPELYFDLHWKLSLCRQWEKGSVAILTTVQAGWGTAHIDSGHAGIWWGSSWYTECKSCGFMVASTEVSTQRLDGQAESVLHGRNLCKDLSILSEAIRMDHVWISQKCRMASCMYLGKPPMSECSQREQQCKQQALRVSYLRHGVPSIPTYTEHRALGLHFNAFLLGLCLALDHLFSPYFSPLRHECSSYLCPTPES